MRIWGVGLFLLLAGCRGDDPPGYGATQVRLVNVGSASLDSVVVRVTGVQYPVGQLGPGDSVTVDTRPTGETSVYVEYARQLEPLKLDVYFEPGYGGRVRAEITADLVSRVDHEHGF